MLCMAGEPSEILSSVEEGERCQSNIPIHKWGDTAFCVLGTWQRLTWPEGSAFFIPWSGDKIELSLESK